MMRTGRHLWLRRALVIVMAVAVTVTVVPVFGGEVSAAGPDRIEFKNITGYTVLPKGGKLKIKTARYGQAAGKKVRFSTSKKRVATVSKKGVIKAKRNGKVTITAYVKINGKKWYKQSVRIRVGKRVSSIKIKGYDCVRVGKSITLKATASPTSAKERGVWWTSSDSGIARVNENGVVTGVREGSATIKAIARDGSGVTKAKTIHVYRLDKNEVKWVAHRGLHTSEKENSRQAFSAAGQAGFYGCECDIYETKRVKERVKQDNEEEGGNESQYVETFELVINHDKTFNRVFGVNREVEDMTAEEIRTNDKLKDRVCFLGEYLDICKQYGMVPVIEMKGTLSDAGIAMMAKEVSDRGLLQKANFISFSYDNLVKTRRLLQTAEYGMSQPSLTYLISTTDSKSIALAKAQRARDSGFAGVSINWGHVWNEFDQYCRRNGLKMDLWTFKNTADGLYNLHQIMKHRGYQVDRYTVDFKPW